MLDIHLACQLLSAHPPHLVAQFVMGLAVLPASQRREMIDFLYMYGEVRTAIRMMQEFDPGAPLHALTTGPLNPLEHGDSAGWEAESN